MAEKKIKLAPVHPGEILREDFMAPLGLSINALARTLHVPPNHVSGIEWEARHERPEVPSASTIFWHDGGTLAWTATGLRTGPGPRYGRRPHPKRVASARELD